MLTLNVHERIDHLPNARGGDRDAHEYRFRVGSPELFGNVEQVFQARVLDRTAFFAQPEPWRAWVFHAAEHIQSDDPRVHAHLEQQPSDGP